MSVYYIDQNFSFRDHFTIKDKNQRDIFYAEEELLSLGKRITLRTMDGGELLSVREKILRWLPQYEFYIGDQLVGEVKRDFSLFKPRYSMSSPAWTIQGDIWSYNYKIEENNQLIAEINKKVLSFMDAYEIEVHQDQYMELVLGIVIALDADLAKR